MKIKLGTYDNVLGTLTDICKENDIKYQIDVDNIGDIAFKLITLLNMPFIKFKVGEKLHIELDVDRIKIFKVNDKLLEVSNWSEVPTKYEGFVLFDNTLYEIKQQEIDEIWHLI